MPSETIANGTTQIFHRLDLNEYGLRDVPREEQASAKQDVADYLENQILRDVNNGVSPVNGEGRFARLDDDYAVRIKGGVRLANLEKEGDLLNDFDVSVQAGSFLDIGHKSGQTPKADGHNQLSGKAKAWARGNGFPRRRYIPDDNQTFTTKITDEIKIIIAEFKGPEAPTPQQDDEEEESVFDALVSSVVETADETTVTSSSLFSDDVIDTLLADALSRRG